MLKKKFHVVQIKMITIARKSLTDFFCDCIELLSFKMTHRAVQQPSRTYHVAKFLCVDIKYRTDNACVEQQQLLNYFR